MNSATSETSQRAIGIPSGTRHDAIVSETLSITQPIARCPLAPATDGTRSDVISLHARQSGGAHLSDSVVQLDAQLRELPTLLGSPAARRLVARVLRVPRGPFEPAAIVESPSQWLGLLVLDGLMTVDLDCGRAQVSWLVGAEDLIRPWEMSETALTEQPSWHVLRESRVALLDPGFSRRAAGIAPVSGALLRRSTQTIHWLLAKSLVLSAPVVEDRLLLLFSLLAERWGKVGAEGVRMELPLTHNLLGKMCGARRPSVTTALTSLSEAGLIECTRRGCWLLRGGPLPPHETDKWTRNLCWRHYAQTIGFDPLADRQDHAPWPPNGEAAARLERRSRRLTSRPRHG